MNYRLSLANLENFFPHRNCPNEHEHILEICDVALTCWWVKNSTKASLADIFCASYKTFLDNLK